MEPMRLRLLLAFVLAALGLVAAPKARADPAAVPHIAVSAWAGAGATSSSAIEIQRSRSPKRV